MAKNREGYIGAGGGAEQGGSLEGFDIVSLTLGTSKEQEPSFSLPFIPPA